MLRNIIIMGKKEEKGFLKRFFGDNVSSRVVEKANCPVFFVGQ